MYTGGSHNVLANRYHQAQDDASSATPCGCYATNPSCTGKQSQAHVLHDLCTQPTSSINSMYPHDVTSSCMTVDTHITPTLQ